MARISTEQARALQSALDGKSFSVTVSWTAGDPEGAYFADLLVNALAFAGLSIGAAAPMQLLGEQKHGLHVSGWNEEELVALDGALRSAGLDVSKMAKFPNPGNGEPGSVTDIFVGFRYAPATTG